MIIRGRNVRLLLERETVLGLKIPVAVDVSEIDFEFGPVKISDLLGLKDASGTFTGYFDKALSPARTRCWTHWRVYLEETRGSHSARTSGA